MSPRTIHRVASNNAVESPRSINQRNSRVTSRFVFYFSISSIETRAQLVQRKKLTYPGGDIHTRRPLPPNRLQLLPVATATGGTRRIFVFNLQRKLRGRRSRIAHVHWKLHSEPVPLLGVFTCNGGSRVVSPFSLEIRRVMNRVNKSRVENSGRIPDSSVIETQYNPQSGLVDFFPISIIKQ